MTQEVFDEIASGWYSFRHHTIFKTELESLAGRWQKGSLLNIGCGHGPDFLPFKTGFELYGVDFSLEMLHFAQKYSVKYKFSTHLALADARRLPFKGDSFDFAISIASYHHIEDMQGRLEALVELKRVLKPGSQAFITVWNHGQRRFWFTRADTLVPWRQREKVLYRYYHLFNYGEIEKLIRKAGLKIIRSFPEASYRFPLKYFSRNICVLVEK